MPTTMFEKIWASHVVHEEPGTPAILYVDLHLVHEVTSPQAFDGLRSSGRKVRRPDLTVATVDHNVPTHDRSLPIADDMSAKQLKSMTRNAPEFGIPYYDMPRPRQDSWGFCSTRARPDRARPASWGRLLRRTSRVAPIPSA